MSNNYTGIKRIGQSVKDAHMPVRCASKLLELRKSLQPICKQKSDSSLLLATWNIRDFDSNKFRFGPRLEESFYYIAEIISAFDLVALQEINRDLAPLERLMRILGREWDYIVTDVTEGTGGAGERMAFVFNTEKVWFRKVAGEIVLPEGQLIVARKKVSAKEAAESDTETAKPKISADAAKTVKKEFKEVEQQFARSPFLVAFQSGWFRFSLCTVHIYYGSNSGEKLAQRISEIQQLMKFFAKRQDSEIKSADKNGDPRSVENYILLGDFNVVSPEHKTMQALKSEGFVVPPAIDGKKVRDEEEDHFYDQIAVRVKDQRFNVAGGGLLDVFDVVFRDEDLKTYERFMPKKDPEAKKGSKPISAGALYKKWRTWQMSDHNPLWIKIDTDFADHYLTEIVEQAKS
jgi:hypothetical protein